MVALIDASLFLLLTANQGLPRPGITRHYSVANISDQTHNITSAVHLSQSQSVTENFRRAVTVVLGASSVTL